MPTPTGYKVKTNTTKGSVHTVDIKPIKFSDIWAKYPEGHPSQDKDAKGELLYKDQCAIKLSVALHGAGVGMASFKGEGRILLNGKHTALRAQELANWLIKQPFPGIARPESIQGEDWQSKIKGRTGIIFFKDYWKRKLPDGTYEKNPSGDHIDLWNKDGLTRNWLTFLRFSLGLEMEMERFSIFDLRKSKEIVFWEIK